MKVGVVILNYNTGSEVCNFFNRIVNYKKIERIVVVDNASTDDSRKQIEQLKSFKLKSIFLDTNGGYAAGNNAGLKYLCYDTDIDICIIANPDVYFDENIVDLLINGFSIDDKIGVLGVERVDGNKEYSQIQCWNLPDYTRELLDTTIILNSFIKHKNIFRFNNKQKLHYVDVIPGSFLAMRKEILKKIGFLDEGTFLYYEENILSYKIKSINMKNAILSNGYIIHNHDLSSTNKLSNARLYFILFKSRKYYQKKCLKMNLLQKVVLDIMMLYFLITHIIIFSISNHKI